MTHYHKTDNSRLTAHWCPNDYWHQIFTLEHSHLSLQTALKRNTYMYNKILRADSITILTHNSDERANKMCHLGTVSLGPWGVQKLVCVSDWENNACICHALMWLAVGFLKHPFLWWYLKGGSIYGYSLYVCRIEVLLPFKAFHPISAPPPPFQEIA